MNLICVNCGVGLHGKQKKYCSRECKNTVLNQQLQSYKAQQDRGRERKLEIIKLKGKKCQKCGYDKNFAALEFHHDDPTIKSLQLDLRSLSNRRWELILDEIEKCRLLCSNCHAEEHNPDCFING